MSEQNVEPKGSKPEMPVADEKACKNLFPAKPDLKKFPFTPFIPTIIAIALFVYPLINMEFKSITIKDSIILYIVGFFIVFMQAFSSIFDSKWWEYYEKKSKSKGGFQAFLIILSVALTSCIEKMSTEVDIIAGMPGHVEYFNYPFNYLIYVGIIIAICIAMLGKIASFEKTKNIQDTAKTFVALGGDDRYDGAGKDVANASAFPVESIFLKNENTNEQYGFLKYGLGILGIIFSIFTNWFVSKQIDPDFFETYTPITGKSTLTPEKMFIHGSNKVENLKFDKKFSGMIAYVIRIFKWISGLVAITLFAYNFSLWNMNTN